MLQPRAPAVSVGGRIVRATTNGTGSMNAFDAAYQILGEAGGPLHYRELTERMIASGLWTERGQGATPWATVNATISRDIQNNGAASRFRRTAPGVIAINEHALLPALLPPELTAEIEKHNSRMRASLLRRARDGSPADFEQLVRTLLEQAGLENLEMTPLSSDGGIDVRGGVVVAGVVHIRIAVQAKRWTGNVGRPVVQQLRGSLGAHEQGLIITTSGFTAGAKEEAERPDASPVALMDGDQLARLLADHQVGAKQDGYHLLRLVDPKEDSAA